jgi:hypothetical protein
MSRAAAVPVPVSRPTGIDYFLMFLGCALSLYLNHISGPQPEAKDNTPGWIKKDLLPQLPPLLYLSQGIILLWPLFYGTQRALGRSQALSAGEWLWGFAWLGTLLVTAWVLWGHLGTLPGFADNLGYPPQFIWTIIAGAAMALIALVIGLIGVLARWKQPWTHTFGLVLLIWPMFPLAGLLLWTERGWTWAK